MSYHSKYSRPGREGIADEYLAMVQTAARFRRRHHYMCRNRDGQYSVQDLMMVTFAAETADSLARHIKQMLDQYDAKVKADERYKDRCVLAEAREEYENRDNEMSEHVARQLLEQIYQLEMKEIKAAAKIPADLMEKEDREAIERAHTAADNSKKAASWWHKFSHLKWCERAQRIDMTSGEEQDFKNMIAAFRMV